MAKKVSPEQKLKANQKKLQKLENWCNNEKFKINDKKEKLKESTVKQYFEEVKAINNLYYKTFGEADVTKMESEKVHAMLVFRYKNPFTLKHKMAAMNYFVQATEESNVFKSKIDCYDHTFMQEYCEDRGIVRRAADTSVKISTHDELGLVVNEIRESRSAYKEQAEMVINLGKYVGTRVSGALHLKGKDILIHKNGNATVYLKEKGGLERWVTISDPNAVDYLKEIKSSLKSQDHLVVKPMRYQSGERKGQLMTNEKARQRLAEVVNPAAKRAGVNSDTQNVTIHSSRKTFTQDRINHYSHMTEDELQLEVQKRILENKELQEEIQRENPEFSITDVEEKWAGVIQRINWVDEDAGIRRTRIDRDPNHKELSYFLASLDTGHFRLDVIRFYAKYFGFIGEASMAA